MAAAQKPSKDKDKDKGPDKSVDHLKQETLNALIGEQVIHALGAPGDLLRVQVKEVWEGHYRVNVLAGSDAASVRVCNSYFLTADPDGNIVSSTPTICKQY